MFANNNSKSKSAQENQYSLNNDGNIQYKMRRKRQKKKNTAGNVRYISMNRVPNRMK